LTNKRNLLAVGHTALDYIMTLKEFPKANYSAPIDNMQNFYGGAAANVAIVGATVGLKTSLVSAVGNEFLNSEYKKKMDDLDVNIDSFIIVNNKSTPTAFVLTDENRNQISYFYWGAAEEFKNSEIPEKAINNSEVVHLATGDPYFNWKCGIFAKEQGKIVSFDPGQDLGMYSPEKLKEVIINTSILFGNHFEIKRILDSIETDIQGLMELGPKIVIKTCGEEGSEIYTDKEKIKIDAVVSDVIDPTGAGDSYRAGFLARYINGESIENSAKFASSVASFIIESEGCQTNIPSFDKAYERMNKFYSE
jgi:ribokinase